MSGGWRDHDWGRKPKTRPEPPKSPNGSWWITAGREHFTETAKTLVKEPPPFLMNNKLQTYDA